MLMIKLTLIDGGPFWVNLYKIESMQPVRVSKYGQRNWAQSPDDINMTDICAAGRYSSVKETPEQINALIAEAQGRDKPVIVNA